MRHLLLRLAASALVGCLPSGGLAEPGPLPPHVTELALVEGWWREDGAHVAAIVIQLEPGWHTYWRVPGEAGIPPNFDWSASDNLRDVAYEWPRPAVFDTFGSTTIGFKDSLVLPVVLTPHNPGAPLSAAVDVLFGVCNDICIPAQARLSARIGAGDAIASPVARARIERALAARPLDEAEAGITGVECRLAAGAAGPELTAEITFATPPAPGLLTVIEAQTRPDDWAGIAKTRTEGRHVRAKAPMHTVASSRVVINRAGMRLTLLDQHRAIDIRGCGSRD